MARASVHLTAGGAAALAAGVVLLGARIGQPRDVLIGTVGAVFLLFIRLPRLRGYFRDDKGTLYGSVATAGNSPKTEPTAATIVRGVALTIVAVTLAFVLAAPFGPVPLVMAASGLLAYGCEEIIHGRSLISRERSEASRYYWPTSGFLLRRNNGLYVSSRDNG